LTQADISETKRDTKKVSYKSYRVLRGKEGENAEFCIESAAKVR